MAINAQSIPLQNNKREIFGWAMYDWANSAFSTTVVTVFLGPYLASLATAAAEAQYLAQNGVAWTPQAGLPLLVHLAGIPIAPDSFFPYCVSLSVLLQVLLLPIMGAIADYSHRRKQLMQVFATLGAAATILLFFIQGDLWALGGLLFLIANLTFGAAMVFYNAYLPDIASEEKRDSVSSYGWAMGYMGGGLLLLLNLIFYQFREALGVPTALAVRINLASAGIWWIGFSLFTWARLQPRHAHRDLPKNETYVSAGFKQLAGTLRELKHFPETMKYLLAYFLYNDGIQTVISVAATFAAAPIINGGIGLDTGTLTMVILMIQFMAFFGALLWGKLAERIGAKQAIFISLIIWAGVTIYAYGGMKGESRVLEFFILGGFIAIVMGGSQAISRSLFAQMIPAGKEAEFYSFYEVSERGTSWVGPLLFGLMNQIFGNLRIAILSLIFFFIMGLILLPRVNVTKAIADVKAYKPA
ncbi:MAG: MFS transporter [Anaerolineae bacterium CG_4_9_14_3_um_filter_57_17]|nr:MFS transporter [bacterium]NCT20842.1 MFS transporter [bacterium]OIO84444.1 MAG: MFS transporter [Anaerolineae bacterium CG2_30_57_67]PJB65214.1 MAG: MFS transporter [Anaerolineae bacterium CG_4_9_14_3_um_filter_57_17]